MYSNCAAENNSAEFDPRFQKNDIQGMIIHERRGEKIVCHGNDECAHRCLANLINSDWNELTES